MDGNIGTDIANLRLSRGLTQADLARKIGTKQPAIARIEQGHTPSLRTLLRITKALNARLIIRLEPLPPEQQSEHEEELASQAMQAESAPVP